MIRLANKFDIPNIITLLYKFRDEYGSCVVSQFSNETHVAKLLTISIISGAVYVAEEETNIVGIIAGYKTPLVWDPDSYVINELAFYVDPDYRFNNIGSELLTTYLNKMEELVDKEQIKGYTMQVLPNTPNLGLEDYGMKKAEQIYVGGM